MFQILKAEKSIGFMRWSKVAFVFSIFMIAASIFTLSTKWLNWGLDFTGGTLIEVGFENQLTLKKSVQHLMQKVSEMRQYRTLVVLAM